MGAADGPEKKTGWTPWSNDMWETYCSFGTAEDRAFKVIWRFTKGYPNRTGPQPIATEIFKALGRFKSHQEVSKVTDKLVARKMISKHPSGKGKANRYLINDNFSEWIVGTSANTPEHSPQGSLTFPTGKDETLQDSKVTLQDSKVTLQDSKVTLQDSKTSSDQSAPIQDQESRSTSISEYASDQKSTRAKSVTVTDNTTSISEYAQTSISDGASSVETSISEYAHERKLLKETSLKKATTSLHRGTVDSTKSLAETQAQKKGEGSSIFSNSPEGKEQEPKPETELGTLWMQVLPGEDRREVEARLCNWQRCGFSEQDITEAICEYERQKPAHKYPVVWLSSYLFARQKEPKGQCA